VVCATGGCARRAAVPGGTSAPRPAAGFQLEQVKSVVADYIHKLENGEYPAAHALLTTASKQKFVLAQFEAQAKQSSIMYDLDRAQAQEMPGGRAKVSVPMLEDPAVKSFVLEREQGHWRIVYGTGRPWAPYP